MREKNFYSKNFTELRKQAENKVQKESPDVPENLDVLLLEETRKLFHELQVYQVELEIQNEELRRTQLELEVSRSRYFNLYDLAPFGYVTLDEHGIIQEANLTSAQLLGLDKGDLVKQPLTRFIAGEDQDCYYLYRKQLFKKQAQEACEIKVIRKDGSCFWARVKLILVQDGENGGQMYRGVLIDITQRKEAEKKLEKAHLELERRVKERTWELETVNTKLLKEITERKKTEYALRKSEEHFRHIVELMPLAIFGHNEREIVFANMAAANLVGVESSKSLAGKSLVEYLHPEYKKLFFQQLKQVMNKKTQGKTFTAKLVLPMTETEIDVELFLTQFTYQCSPTIQITAENITRRKKMQEERLKADKLESISILAGGIAHDINNYLTILLANTSLALLYKEDIPEKVSKYLENMEQASLRAKAFTQKLSTFAKGGEPVKKTVSINNLISDCTIFSLSGSNVCYQLSISEDLKTVEIDEGQITQVLNNIIINAVQAMPDGGTIKIIAENIILENAEDDNPADLTEGEYVKISIKDQGVGIPEKSLQKIFDPFFTTKDDGSGLGLAVSYSIIKNHNGCIQVEYKKEKETTFNIFIPASTEKVLEKTEKDEIIYGTGKILIMDDEEDIREAACDMLSQLGYEAHYVGDGSEAIIKYLEAKKTDHPFDLVVMDLTIPGGMGGKDTIKILLDEDPEIKAVVSSGYSTEPIMANFDKYGFKGVIQKPYQISVFSKVIFEIINSAE